MAEGFFELVFVYGSLLTGMHNHHLLEGSKLAGQEVVHGFTLRDLGSYPAVVEDANAEVPVFGEVWKVSPETFARLDRLEGYPQYYNRKLVETFEGPAWIYFYNGAVDYPTVTYGDWKQYLEEKGRLE